MEHKIKHRRPIVLLEILISMGLLAILVTVLFGYYRYITQVEIQTSAIRAEAFSKRLLHARLARTVGRMTAKGVLYTEERTGQFMTGPSLVFSYDNQAVMEPEFSGIVVGRLYLEPDGRLCLATWPKDLEPDQLGQPPMQHEVLASGIRGIRFEFYYPYEDKQPDDRVLLVLPKEDKAPGLPMFVTVILESTTSKAEMGLDSNRFTIPIPASKVLIRYPAT